MNKIEIIKFEKLDCAPCMAVSTALTQKNIPYTAVNAFDNPEKAAEFKIRSLPTTICIVNGQEIARAIGSDIKNVIKEFNKQTDKNKGLMLEL